MADERFDGMLLQFAQQHKGIDDVLTTFLGFLRRKTDFFTGQTASGQAEKVVVKVCREQEALAERTMAERKKRLAKQQAEVDARNVAKAAKRAEALKKAAAPAPAPAPAATGGGDDDDDDDAPTLAKPAPAAAAAAADAAPAVPTTQPQAESTPVEPFENADEEEDKDEDKGALPNAGNGGSGPGYDWTQTLKDLVINVHVPLGTRAKHLTVDVKKDYIRVGRKGEDLILDGKLSKTCRPEDLIWTIDDNDDDTGRVVSLELPKKNQMEWWKCIVEGHPVINTSKVEPENSKLSDLDRDTRQTVEKMMFDQRQKAMNKPTSDEMNKQAMMEKFMKAHPEMDFSNVKMS